MTSRRQLTWAVGVEILRRAAAVYSASTSTHYSPNGIKNDVIEAKNQSSCASWIIPEFLLFWNLLIVFEVDFAEVKP